MGERTVVSIHLLYRVGDMYQCGAWIDQVESLCFFYFHTFFLKIVLAINELHCHKKILTYLTKTLKSYDYDMI